VDKLRLEFELKSPGRVWIDEVQVFDLRFNPPEFAQLRQIVAWAADYFEQGDYGQCLRVLDGYWPRFLSAYVPLGPSQIANQPQKPAEKAASRSGGTLDAFKEKMGLK
jgi:hypothetical protein